MSSHSVPLLLTPDQRVDAGPARRSIALGATLRISLVTALYLALMWILLADASRLTG